MRVHISLPEDVVADVDRQVGARERSSFIEKALRRALDDISRSDALQRALGSIEDGGHEWDGDPAQWVRRQRSDPRRAG